MFSKYILTKQWNEVHMYKKISKVMEMGKTFPMFSKYVLTKEWNKVYTKKLINAKNLEYES